MQQTVLILGGTGRFGRAAAEAFWNAGWRVRVFDRKVDRLPEAALGADVIVNGWNPPYTQWADLLPGLTDTVIEAARASGATVIQAANIYVYGDGSPETLGPDTPHAARNPMGRLRIDMEARLREAGIPLILLRAGDFIDTEGSGNWFDRVLMAKLAKDRVAYPGNPDIPHAWAYLPDLGRAAVALAERRAALARRGGLGPSRPSRKFRLVAALPRPAVLAPRRRADRDAVSLEHAARARRDAFRRTGPGLPPDAGR